MSDSATRRLAAFAVEADDFPPLARARATDAITDCIGCMLAGSAEALAAPLLRVLTSVEAPSESALAPLLGTKRHAAPCDAALYNGAIAHALDFDDTNHPAYAHPSAVIVPALLAVAPRARCTGRDLVTAYILGLEVFGKLGRALNRQHYKRGWHSTSTFGTLAATVAAGRLLRLSEQQMVMALGIAASAAGGLRVNFGSMVKPLHAGYAARNGVLAVLLAREGLLASEVSLEHPLGYVSVFNDSIGHDMAPLLSFGEPLEILTEYGLALKPYPSCGATHCAIEAASQLHQQLAGEPIRSARAGVCEMAFAPLIHVMPHAPLEGKFSLHYCVAAALLDGSVNLATFSDEKIADPRIRALIPKISMELDERIRDESEFPTILSVDTESGKRYESTVLLAAGKPRRWFSEEQIRAKFLDCAAARLPQARRAGALRMLRSLDEGVAMHELLAALSS